mgnify:CR=1 FL=1
MQHKYNWGLAMTLCAGLARADSGAIEELVITASPHGKSAEEIAGSLNILDRETLKREVAATLGETLHNQLGVVSSSFGPGVGLPVIRGLSGKRVAVLQNSNAIGDASATSPDHAVATEALLADRIEILRGPATLRFGPGAIGGVVNVIDNRIHTERFKGVDGAVEGRHDTNTHGNVLVGRLDAGTGNFVAHLDGVMRDSRDVEIPGRANRLAAPDETSDGFIDNTDTEARSWSLGLSRITDTMSAGISVQRLNNEYGIPPGAHEHHEEHEEEGEGHEEEEHGDALFTRIDMDQTVYQAKLAFSDLGGWLQSANLDLSHTDYGHRELEIEEGIASVGTRFETDLSEGRAELTHIPVAGWTGTLGLHLSQRDFDAVGEEAFVPPSVTDNRGLFLLEERDLGAATLELGLRHDRQTVDSSGLADIDHTSINASASLLYPVTDSQQVGVTLSRTERAPTAEELLSDGLHVATNTYEVGDASLDTESALNLELTWRYQGAVDLHAALYHRRFRDFLYLRDTGSRFSHDLEEAGATGLAACSSRLADFDNDIGEFEEAVTCFRHSQDDARFTGAELEATVAITASQSVRLWGDVVRAEFDDGMEVPRLPAARLGGAWNLNSGPWALQLSLTHGFRQDRPGENQPETDDYTRLDAYLNYGADHWSVFLKGTNLTDNEIRNATSFLRDLAPEPGRSLVIGANYRF